MKVRSGFFPFVNEWRSSATASPTGRAGPQGMNAPPQILIKMIRMPRPKRGPQCIHRNLVTPIPGSVAHLKLSGPNLKGIEFYPYKVNSTLNLPESSQNSPYHSLKRFLTENR